MTGGEYDASVGDLSLGVANSSYSVPFLGLYAAVLGHGFFGDVMFRHDFWEGRASSPAAGLTSARLDGGANVVTAEAGDTFRPISPNCRGFHGAFVCAYVCAYGLIAARTAQAQGSWAPPAVGFWQAEVYQTNAVTALS